MALRATNILLNHIAAGNAYTFTRIELGTGTRTPDGTETGIMTPFNPVRQQTNPPGLINDNARVVDWVDGVNGDGVAYVANEAGVFGQATVGGVLQSEQLFLYDSSAGLVTKTSGLRVVHRFAITLSATQLANATFSVQAVGAASETTPGIQENATQAETNNTTAPIADDKTVTPQKLQGWWGGITVPIDKGGTGATTQAAAKTALGIGVEVVVHTTQTSYDNASSSDGKLHVLAV